MQYAVLKIERAWTKLKTKPCVGPNQWALQHILWLPNETKNNNTSSHMFLDHCYAFGLLLYFRSEEEVCWRRGPPVTYIGPALDPPLGGSGRKTTTLVRDLENFIHTKFHQNSSSGSGEEVKYVNCLTDDRQTDGRQTPDNAWSQ